MTDKILPFDRSKGGETPINQQSNDASQPQQECTVPAAPEGPTEKFLVAAGFGDLVPNPAPEQLEQVVRRLAMNVKCLDGVQVSLVRQEAIKRLKQLGVQGAARLLDAAVSQTFRAGQSKEEQGKRFKFEDPEPWPEPVDGAALLDRIEQTLARYLILPLGAATAIALWIMFTYTIGVASIAPILLIMSPIKRCGKTQLLILIKGLAWRALAVSNITAAAIFRLIEQQEEVTLLIDEADSFMQLKEELRNILNSGHTREAAWVVRASGENFDPQVFSTWSAKAVAMIGHPPSTVEDRSIVIKMRRRAPWETAQRLRLKAVAGELSIIRRQARRWANDKLEKLKDADPVAPVQLNDRAADNWRPLLAIADRVGGTWPTRARDAAVALHQAAGTDGLPVEVQLLKDFRDLFGRYGNRITSQTVVNELGRMEDRPWPEWRHGQPITTRQLADLLRPFDLSPKKIRLSEAPQPLQGYEKDDFFEAFARYLPEPLEQPEHPKDSEEAVVLSVPEQELLGDLEQPIDDTLIPGLVPTVPVVPAPAKESSSEKDVSVLELDAGETVLPHLEEP